MIDTHAHLDFKDFDQDREEVIQRFFSQGGKAIINIGVNLERSRKSIEIAEAHENIFAAVGFHPEYFTKHITHKMEQEFAELKKMAKNKKVVAIGETGLDYFSHTGEPISEVQKENQKKGFVAQLELAQELDLPVIIHCRSSKENPTDAYDDIYEIITGAVRAQPLQGHALQESTRIWTSSSPCCPAASCRQDRGRIGLRGLDLNR